MAATVIVAAAAAAACGGATAVETVVGPDAVRCQTTASAQPTTVPPNGGNVNVTVAAARDCTWTASSDAAWMHLSATSGQGDSTLAVTVARNDVPTPRNGTVAVNEQRLTISQEPRPCTFELRASVERFSSAGGRGSVAVETITGCAWTAASSASWLRVLTPSGSGAGTVQFEVLANADGSREGSITIGGRSVTIEQSGAESPPPQQQPACTITANPTTINAPAGGGTHTISISTNAGCDWSASSNADWVRFPSGASGRGSGPLTTAVAQNAGGARTAAVTVGREVIAVNQAAAPVCTYSLDPRSRSIGAGGGEGRVTVTAQPGCTWSASGAPEWVSITSGSGTGRGEVVYLVQANAGSSPRSGSFAVNGESHTVNQEAPAPTCTYSLQPQSRNFGASGGEGRVTVVTQEGCAWSASSGAEWARLTTASGTGRNDAVYTVLGNTSASTRATTITINGQTHDVTQDAAAQTCTYTLQPESQNFNAAGGSGGFEVVTQPGCAWTAQKNADWIALGTAAGSGRGPIGYTVQANAASSTRSTTIVVNGRLHTITQDAAAPPCTFNISPGSQNFPAAGGTGRFTLATQEGCSWSATRGDSWVTVTTPTGSGPREVTYTVEANSATTPRQTTVTVGGRTHQVNQEAAQPPPPPPCSFSIDPNNRDFTNAGGQGTVRVTTGPTCAWTASSPVDWIKLAASGGTGTNDLGYTVVPQTGPEREATITVAGHGHRVRQRPN